MKQGNPAMSAGIGGIRLVVARAGALAGHYRGRTMFPANIFYGEFEIQRWQ
jgi:hypothetical protein